VVDGIGVDIPFEMFESASFDVTMHNLLWFALTMSILTVNLYQLLKPLIKKKIKTHEIQFGIDGQNDQMIEKELDFKHLFVPLVIAMVVGFTFPVTYFNFMPFQTYNVWLDRFYTGVIFGGISNGFYTNYNMIKELGLSLIGRIIGIKRY